MILKDQQSAEKYVIRNGSKRKSRMKNIMRQEQIDVWHHGTSDQKVNTIIKNTDDNGDIFPKGALHKRGVKDIKRQTEK